MLSLILIGIAIYISRQWLGEPTAPFYDYQAELDEVVAQDPPLGERISWARGPIDSGKPSILVFSSLCACDTARLQQIQIGSATQFTFRIVVPASKSEFERIQKLMPYKRLFVFDPDLELVKQANAYFVSRAYVLDGDGRIVWRSVKYKSDWMDLVKEADQFARSNRI